MIYTFKQKFNCQQVLLSFLEKMLVFQSTFLIDK